MSLRKPFAVAVVGALLVGGATTGTTLALWHDETTVDSGTLDAGNMALSVTNGGEIQLGDLTLRQGGPATSITATVTDDSPVGAVNLRQEVTLSSVRVTSEGSLTEADLLLEVTRKSPAGCPTGAPTSTASGYTTSSLGLTTPGDSFEICVRVAASTTAPVGSQGTLNLSFTGVQVR